MGKVEVLFSKLRKDADSNTVKAVFIYGYCSAGAKGGRSEICKNKRSVAQ